MNEWLRENLVCPRDKQKLKLSGNNLVCSENHSYPVVDDIPIMLLEEEERIHNYMTETLASVAEIQTSDKTEPQPLINAENEVDPFVQAEIPLTSGNLYTPLQNKLTRYPLPEFRMPQSSGERLIDVGCNWGRWSITAAQKGYKPVGIDPSLRAVLAARRVSKQLKVSTDFVVGDARHLPFAESCFDAGFSYGVFQHFSKENAKTSLEEIARVVKKDGNVMVQMPNKYGIRSFQQQARRNFSEGKDFEVRYWTPAELMKFFTRTFGETKLTADCYFGLGIQKNDVDLLPARFKAVVHSSEVLRKASWKLPFLSKVADSVYLESINHNKS